MKKELKSKLFIIASMLIFGSIGVFVRGINLPSSVIALVRGVIGTAFLLIVLLVSRSLPKKEDVRKNILLLFFSGAAIGVNWIFFFEAFKYTTIPNATLSYYFAPVVVILLSPLILKEKLHLSRVLCVLAAVVGMFFVVGASFGGVDKRNLIGIAFGLAAAVLYAAVVLMNKFIKGLSGLAQTTIQLFFATAVLVPYVLLTNEISLSGLGTKSAIMLVTVGIVHTGIAYYLYFTSMQTLSGQTAAVMSYIDPVSAIVFAAIFLNENIGALQAVGGILILGSTYIGEKMNGNQGQSGDGSMIDKFHQQ